MSNELGYHKTITRDQAQSAWLAIDRAGIKELADYLRVSIERAKWFIDAYNLWDYIPLDQQVNISDGMDKHQFWYFMRKLTRAIDENGWDKPGRFTRQGDLPISVLREAQRRRELKCVE